MEGTDSTHNSRLIMEAETAIEEPTELSLLSKLPISPVSEKNAMVVEYGGLSRTNQAPEKKPEGKKLFQFLATLIGKYLPSRNLISQKKLLLSNSDSRSIVEIIKIFCCPKDMNKFLND